ncbi:hypothetical protein L4D77_17270 [Photobacterium frigidiphilum]
MDVKWQRYSGGDLLGRGRIVAISVNSNQIKPRAWLMITSQTRGFNEGI